VIDKRKPARGKTPADPRPRRPHARDQQNGYVERASSGEPETMPPDAERANKLDDGFRVGDFEVYPKRLALVRGDATVRLEPKVMQVLQYLAERADDVVTRDDFFDHVWKGRIVTDEVLNRDIAILRSQLGDDAREPTYVLTIPRVGYRLIAQVRPLREPVEPHAAVEAVPDPTPSDGDAQENGALPPIATPNDSSNVRRPRRSLISALIGGLAVIGLIYAVEKYVPKPKHDTKRIAVLPFENLPKDADRSISDGLSEEIQSTLSTVGTINVVARNSVYLIDPREDPATIGEKLNAGLLIEGTVRRDGDRLRITAETIDTNSGLQTWSNSYEGHLSDIFEIQSEIATSIAHQFVAPEIPTTDMEAHTLYLRANQSLRSRDFPHAIELYQQAIARDGRFARAYAELAEAYILQPSYDGSSEKAGHALALDAESRAEALGEDPLRASGMRAYMQFRTHQWRAARDTFDVARSALPNNAEVLQWYSQYLASVGRIDDAKRAAEAAVTADPLWPAANQRAGFLNIWSDRAKADRYFQTAAEGSQLGLPEARLAYLLTEGRVDEARKVLLATQAARKQSVDWIEPALAAVARTGPAHAAIDALHRDYRAGMLGVSMYLGALFMIGDVDAVYSAMPEIIANGEPFDVEVFFSDSDNGRVLRTDPRFAGLMQRLGLIDFWDATVWPDKCARTAGNIACR